MKLLDLHNFVLEKGIPNVNASIESSLGILKVKRGKIVLSQKEKFEFLKYFIH
jgi:hypothetical protein